MSMEIQGDPDNTAAHLQRMTKSFDALVERTGAIIVSSTKSLRDRIKKNVIAASKVLARVSFVRMTCFGDDCI